jgi:hypothetical protein
MGSQVCRGIVYPQETKTPLTEKRQKGKSKKKKKKLENERTYDKNEGEKKKSRPRHDATRVQGPDGEGVM